METASHVPILLLVGLAVVAGEFGARVFRFLRIPQVVGYIVIGILVGKSGLGLIGDGDIQALTPVTFFALGVIGFLVGSELSAGVFRKYGKQFFVILFAEGLGAFLLVGAASALVAYAVTGDAAGAAALGMVLGAIASATAPAATVDVLWEHKTLGPLTTTVLAIVALDDILSLLLFSVASGVAARMMGGTSSTLLSGLGHTAYEIGGAVLQGVLAGFLLNLILRHTREKGRSLTYLVGVIALLLGFSLLLELDVIMPAMVLGVTLVNLAPRRIKAAREVIERFAPPIFVVFFVVVGAKLSIASMPTWLWWLVLAYVFGRTAGKISGAWMGARVARAQATVRKYLGLCLFSQAGVAIGLAIVAGERFSQVSLGGEAVGQIILGVVAATTFVVQLIGPPCVKFAASRAGEVGRNVTEEDLINSYKVEDLFDHSVRAFVEETPVAEVARAIAGDEASCHVVTDDDGRIKGVITLDAFKQCWNERGVMDWLVAFDVMRPSPDPVTGDTPLSDALRLMSQQGVGYLPVVDSSGRYLGLLERAVVDRVISRELLSKRMFAEGGDSEVASEPTG